MGGGGSKNEGLTVGGLAKRAGMGAAGIFSFFYGIFEIMLVAILSSIIAANLVNLPSYNTNTDLQNNRKAFIAFSVIFWLTFGAGIIVALIAISTGLVYLSVPYVYFTFIILNFIFTILVFIFAIITLVNLRKTPEYQKYSTSCPENDPCNVVGTVQNTCIALIVIVGISILTLMIFGIWSLRNYSFSTDVEIAKTAISLAAPEAAPAIAALDAFSALGTGTGTGTAGEQTTGQALDLASLTNLLNLIPK
jgi:hypothetical protein